MTTDIITTQEGKKKLAELEGVASTNLHTSREAFDSAILALTEIRDEKLWHYAVDEDEVMLGDYTKPRFKEDYLRLFCRRNNISMSGTYGHLGTVETAHYLGITNDTIRDVGVRELSPVKRLVRIDGRSGEIKLPPPEVIERLPPGDTVRERIKAKVEEVFVNPPEKLSPSDALKAIVVDTGIDPDIHVFEAGDGDVWLTYEQGEYLWEGVVIPAEVYAKVTGEAREWLVKRLKITEYTRRKDE